MTDVIASVQELEKSFAGHRVIADLSFSIHEGERTAVFAPSGAGKTTLIKILARLETADNGSVSLPGPAPVVVFQEPRLFPFLTVEENIFLPFKIQNRSITSEVQRRYQHWMEICDLSNFAHHYPYQLSGGMRQKTSLIRSLLGQPALLLLDEPFQSINYASKQAIIVHILETLPDSSILFVSHIAEEIPMLAQNVLFFNTPCLVRPQRMSTADFAEHIAAANPFFIPVENNRLTAQEVKKKETL